MSTTTYVLLAPAKGKYEIVTLPPRATKLKELQRLVGGTVTTIPPGRTQGLTAYANDEGMGLDLASNYLAWGVLTQLGFDTRGTVLPAAYFGAIVLTGAGSKSLTVAQLAQVETAWQAYRAQLGEPAEHGDPEVEPPPKKKRRRVKELAQ